MIDAAQPRVAAVVICDFNRTAIGTRSRLADVIAGKRVIDHVVSRLRTIESIGEVLLLVPADQNAHAKNLATNDNTPVHILDLQRRPDGIDARVRTGRQWNLQSWRGGAGQYTFFDEEYHPTAIAHACAAAFNDQGAEHILIIHSHSAFLDVPMTAALVQHHLHKNHEMRLSYTPSAPGLCGMVLRADIVHEMGQQNVMPWQLLAYDPAQPSFDTLIRDACMQVDPALSKIPNRFCLDTDRAWSFAQQLMNDDTVTRGHADKVKDFALTLSPSQLVTLSPANLALAAARSIAPGVKDFSQVHQFPRELEIELTGRRLTNPPGAVPQLVREARGQLDLQHWQRWFDKQTWWDDVLLTFAGDGDPLLYENFPTILRAARRAGALAICVQTDLAVDNLDPLLKAIDDNLIDALSITMYGHTVDTYNRVAGAVGFELHATVMRNLTTLAPIISARGGVPLVIPRLLKVRETIPEMEPFFDTWIRQSGWAVIDPPTDRAGAVPFAGVVDMAPPKRRPCRRIWDRLLLRANGTAVPCDQDMLDHLTLGNIESLTLEQLWNSPRLTALRQQHATNQWTTLNPCTTCKEWHRP